MTAVDDAPKSATDINADLGFGSVVTRESRGRLLNRDGTFNVRREGLSLWESLSVYHYLLTISWRKFLGYFAATYVLLNLVFAAGFLLCGAGSLSGSEMLGAKQRFAQAFFFSVHTLATIGYGNVVPVSLAANILVTLESLAGLIAFGVVAGIVFARVSRPVANIMFSDVALIAPYRDITAFMFRIVNQKSSQIVDLHATVLLSWRVGGERKFVSLSLERESVVFFPLSWTIVHPIDRDSPLHGIDRKVLAERDSEFLVLLNGFEETFSQTVHTRSSYSADEVVCGARFRGLFKPPGDDGEIRIDIRKLNDIEKTASS